MERIGHRGARRELPENTVAAFKRAFERRADAVELDVHATRDGVVVVHHDPALGSAFGKLSGRSIDELDWPSIASASVTSRTRIPTLAEVLGIAPAGGTVYVEIKGLHIEAQVAEVIGVSRARCAVHSFDLTAVKRMREIAPDIPRGILFDRELANLPAVMADTGARDVWPKWTLIDGPLVDRIHADGGRVIAWTVNDRTAAARLMTLGSKGVGVDGLCTDDVRILDGL
jgi:glycerophosphoryl diester phosphodiesterase